MLELKHCSTSSLQLASGNFSLKGSILFFNSWHAFIAAYLLCKKYRDNNISITEVFLTYIAIHFACHTASGDRSISIGQCIGRLNRDQRDVDA